MTTNHAVLYGLGGLALAITAAAIIKRKPAIPDDVMLIGPGRALKGPRTYTAAKGDKPSAIAARFGTAVPILMMKNGNKPILITSRTITLPSGVADMGPRQGAQGVVR